MNTVRFLTKNQKIKKKSDMKNLITEIQIKKNTRKNDYRLSDTEKKHK